MQAFIKPFWQLGAYDQIAEKLKKKQGSPLALRLRRFPEGTRSLRPVAGLFPEADRHIQRAESKGNL